jgi:hypothetical protein
MRRLILWTVTLLDLVGPLMGQPVSALQSYFPPLDTALIGATYFERASHSAFVRISAADRVTRRPLDNVIVDIDAPTVYLHSGDALRGLWLSYAPYRITVHVNGYTGAIFDSVSFARDSVSEMVAFLSPGSGTLYYKRGTGPLEIAQRRLSGVPEGRIAVRVLDVESHRPIPSARVRLDRTGEECLVDDSGTGSLSAQFPGRELALRVSHRSYGEIVVPFAKRYDASVKSITVNLLKRRFLSRYPRDGSRDEIRFLITKQLWVANSQPGYEFPLVAFVVSAGVGDSFGPPVSWFRDFCFPFRLIRQFSNKAAWVAFSNRFASDVGGSNFAVVDSSITTVNTNVRDGGFELTIQVVSPCP